MIKPIPEFPDYGVSEDGFVWRITPSGNGRAVPYKMNPPVANNGYKMAMLAINGKNRSMTVHRLIAKVFCAGFRDGMEVRHLNGDKTDNRACNLAWGTRLDNMDDRRRLGEHAKGETTPMATISNRQATIAKRLYRDGFRIVDCAYIARIPYHIAKSIAYGRNWKHVE